MTGSSHGGTAHCAWELPTRLTSNCTRTSAHIWTDPKPASAPRCQQSKTKWAVWADAILGFQCTVPAWQSWFPVVVFFFFFRQKCEQVPIKHSFPTQVLRSMSLFYTLIICHCKTPTPKLGAVDLKDILLCDGLHIYDLFFCCTAPPLFRIVQ